MLVKKDQADNANGIGTLQCSEMVLEQIAWWCCDMGRI